VRSSVCSYVVCAICILLVLGLMPSHTGVSVVGVEKFSMAYVFSGDVLTQIGYVEQTNGSLHVVSPSGWFNLNADGSLQVPANRSQFVSRMHELGVRVVVCLNNHWDQSAGVNALENADFLTTQLAYYVELYDLDGINVDIENVTFAQRDLYTNFVALLRAKIPLHKEVSVAVGANPAGTTMGWVGAYDYAALSVYVDYFMIMTYDEHFEGGSAGSVSSISFVEQSIQYVLTKTTGDKIVMGIPFYGRLWSVESSGFSGVEVTNDDIASIVEMYGGVVSFDVVSQSAKVEFTVKEGDALLAIQGQHLVVGRYVVWFEDAQSVQAKMRLVHKYGIKGVGVWALGQEDRAIWSSYVNWLNGYGCSDGFLHGSLTSSVVSLVLYRLNK